jgi:hypothetical protein
MYKLKDTNSRQSLTVPNIPIGILRQLDTALIYSIWFWQLALELVTFY